MFWGIDPVPNERDLTITDLLTGRDSDQGLRAAHAASTSLS